MSTASAVLTITCGVCGHEYPVDRERLFAGCGYLACPRCTPPPPPEPAPDDRQDGKPARRRRAQVAAGGEQERGR